MDEVPADERNFASGLHLTGLAAMFFGVAFLGPLIMWLIRKDESEFVDAHGKAALNFHLSMLIWQAISIVLIVTIIGAIIGIPALIVLGVLQFIMSIVSAIRAAAGDEPLYPLSLSLIR